MDHTTVANVVVYLCQGKRQYETMKHTSLCPEETSVSWPRDPPVSHCSLQWEVGRCVKPPSTPWWGFSNPFLTRVHFLTRKESVKTSVSWVVMLHTISDLERVASPWVSLVNIFDGEVRAERRETFLYKSSLLTERTFPPSWDVVIPSHISASLFPVGGWPIDVKVIFYE